MRHFQIGPGRPIYSIQEYLRVIAMTTEKFPPLIPDGIYGTQTEATVRVFQREYDLPETGEVDNDTWDRIIEVYTEVEAYRIEPPATQLFPESRHVIREGDRAGFLFPIHAVIRGITKHFDNIPDFDVSETHEGGVVDATRELLKRMDLPCDNGIDVRCWNRLSRLYENLESKDIFSMARPNGMDTEAPTEMELVEHSVTIEELNEDMRRETNGGTATNLQNGMFLTPKLDAYDTSNPIFTEDIPIPQNGTPEGDVAAPEFEPRVENVQSVEEAPPAVENEALDDTDMQGNPVLPNPNRPEEARLEENPPAKKEPIRWNFF